jgi:hypothetical protein
MRFSADPRPRWLIPVALLAGAFGVATIVSGGRVLFGSDATRAAAGHIVPFVLWFNFLAGFAYVGTAVGIALVRRWSGMASAGLAAATALVFLAFGVHVLAGGAFEARTVVAMTLRTGVWIAIAVAVCRRLGCTPRPEERKE